MDKDCYWGLRRTRKGRVGRIFPDYKPFEESNLILTVIIDSIAWLIQKIPEFIGWIGDIFSAIGDYFLFGKALNASISLLMSLSTNTLTFADILIWLPTLLMFKTP